MRSISINHLDRDGEVVWDVVVVGGGPTGLAAALMLGRYRRRTLVFDDRRRRFGAAGAIHCIPGLAGIGAWELRKNAWSEIGAYRDVARREATVVQAYRETGGPFVVETRDGETACARLLLATGTEDICPSDVEDFDRYYGRWVHHCPDCDGYQATDRKIGLICWTNLAAPYAMEFLNWTNQITILAKQLGCKLTWNGHVEPDSRQRTSVRDVYAAGDLAPPDETVAVALAEGQIAAITINRSLYGTERWMG